ncbi:DUF4157 domain-containing protein [Dyella jejuensis]|uniref:DUF4157 domain-containing protein n=1 Tax=Dyella jejuensis TaxID=1432009 RepID=A0ABW8JEK4_9GAMM
MKQTVPGDPGKVNTEPASSNAGGSTLHPAQRKVDGSPRQCAQQDRLTQLQEASPQPRSNGLPLPLRTGIEALSGMDMGDVVVHRNSAKPAQLNALAYAQGNEIHLGPGQDQHLPHEAWHVVQQARGRVAPTMQAGDGTPINDDHALEREADVMGARALQRKEAAGQAAQHHAPAYAQGSGLFAPAFHSRQLRQRKVPVNPHGCPIVQRLEVGGKEIAVDASLEPSVARDYLVRLSKKDAEIKVKDNDEYYALALRGMADSEAVQNYQEALARITLARDRSPEIPALKESATTIRDIAAKAIGEANEIMAAGWLIAASNRNWTEMAQAIGKAYNKKTNALSKGNGDIRRIGYRVGLPGFNEATLKDFAYLERVKKQARKTRAPIDDIFKKFSLELHGKLPGAKLAYRGSLARGVKSPSKHVPSRSGPALAEFNAEAYKSNPASLRPSKGVACFDVDANVELPEDMIKDGIVEGPISRSDANNKVIKVLLDLQKQMDKAIKEEHIKGYDTSDPFSFFISSVRKADRQLEQGTPYPIDMLTNAGLTGFAASLPRFWSGELVRKVREYAESRTVWKTDGVWIVPPLDDWDPYFARLYQTIKTSGPRAVAMPDVQVVFEKGAMSEATDTAEPRDDSEFKGPVDLLTPEYGYEFAKLGGVPKVGDFYAGAITKVVIPKKGGNDMVFIDAGDIHFLSFQKEGSGYARDAHVLCKVTSLPRTSEEKHLVNILKVI